MVLSLVVSLLFSVAVCSWLLWEALAYRRITQLPGASWSSSPWGVIGWWFVPMAHLVRPRRLVEELYRNALPELERPSDERARVVQIWWALWLLSQALWLVALVLTEQPHTMEWNALADVLVSLSFTGAAIAAVLVVYSVDRRIARL